MEALGQRPVLLDGAAGEAVDADPEGGERLLDEVQVTDGSVQLPVAVLKVVLVSA